MLPLRSLYSYNLLTPQVYLNKIVYYQVFWEYQKLLQFLIIILKVKSFPTVSGMFYNLN